MQFLPTSYLPPTYFLTSLGHLGHLGPPDLFKKPLGPKALLRCAQAGFECGVVVGLSEIQVMNLWEVGWICSWNVSVGTCWDMLGLWDSHFALVGINSKDPSS